MKKNINSIFKGIVFSTVLCLFVVVNGYGGQYQALDGVKDVKVVFDVRSKKVKSAFVQLGLIHQTFKDRNILEVSAKPQFVVVFGGAAVKLLSTDHEGFSDEEKVLVGHIADILAAMVKDGIRLEICLFAADIYGVEPETILPGIHHVDNGWISLIGYQNKGYSLVAAF